VNEETQIVLTWIWRWPKNSEYHLSWRICIYI